MLEELQKWFEKAWEWIKALWRKHDSQLEAMVQAVLPMVIDMAFRPDLTGEQKRKAIVDAILDQAETSADRVADSMINEAVEIAANRYNIQIGKVTVANMDAAYTAVVKAGRKYLDGALKIAGTEAEEAGVSLNLNPSNEDTPAAQ